MIRIIVNFRKTRNGGDLCRMCEEKKEVYPFKSVISVIVKFRLSLQECRQRMKKILPLVPKLFLAE